MRYVYLIRHAEPALPDAERRCYSRTEFPLSTRGKAQAKELRAWAVSHGISAVFTSPISHCRETAALMSGTTLPVYSVDALRGVDVGEWEGLTFDEIRSRWPKMYAARGNKMSEISPPGGESFRRAAARFDGTLREILNISGGSIAVVTHSGAIRGWLFRFASLGEGDIFSIPAPYAGISTLCIDGRTLLSASAGTCARKAPSSLEINEYYCRCGTPPAVIAHCRAVADKADELVSRSRIICNHGLLHAACLLHDMCRTDGKEHPAHAAHILTMDGYPALAGIIARHHDLSPRAPAEAELLYLSDKLVAGTKTVPLEIRFAESYKKCTGSAAVQNWKKRKKDAMDIVRKYHLEGIV